MENKTEEQVENEFRHLLGKVTDDEFWEYIRSWKDEGDLMDTMLEWDVDTKKDAIEDIKEIMKK